MSTYLITGASGSMGSEAAKSLANQRHHVIMACRNLEKGEKIKQSILQQVPYANLTLMSVDLSRFDSVRSFATEVKQLLQNDATHLDGLFNNAGIINRDYRVTQDGYENTLQVNVLSPAMLTLLLLDSLVPDARIVNMVSLTCRFGKISEDFLHRSEKQFSQLGTYADSKLALLLFSIALHLHREELGLPDLHVNVSDPGVVNSNMISMGRWFDPLADLLFRPLCSSPAKGVAPALRAIASTSRCSYFVGNRERTISKHYLNNHHIEWLWTEIWHLL